MTETIRALPATASAVEFVSAGIAVLDMLDVLATDLADDFWASLNYSDASRLAELAVAGGRSDQAVKYMLEWVAGDDDWQEHEDQLAFEWGIGMADVEARRGDTVTRTVWRNAHGSEYSEREWELHEEDLSHNEGMERFYPVTLDADGNEVEEEDE